MNFRYPVSGSWFKGNAHVHSSASDGGKNFRELAELYASAGYHFLFRTDHWVASDVAADDETYPLLWLDGVELDGQDRSGAYYHAVCLGRVSGVEREQGFEDALRSAIRQGALILLAHPHWCGNSLEEIFRWPFHGVEIYNHVCRWLNGKSDGLVHWDAALMRRPDTLAFAVDDAHLRPEHPGWNGGWIVVQAPEGTPGAIMQGIRRGHFYSSCGPAFHRLSFDGEQVQAETSPVRFARLVGPGYHGSREGSFDGPLIESVRFPVTERQYLYLEIEDDRGRRAWTNNLFVNGIPLAQDPP